MFSKVNISYHFLKTNKENIGSPSTVSQQAIIAPESSTQIWIGVALRNFGILSNMKANIS